MPVGCIEDTIVCLLKRFAYRSKWRQKIWRCKGCLQQSVASDYYWPNISRIFETSVFQHGGDSQ